MGRFDHSATWRQRGFGGHTAASRTALAALPLLLAACGSLPGTTAPRPSPRGTDFPTSEASGVAAAAAGAGEVLRAYIESLDTGDVERAAGSFNEGARVTTGILGQPTFTIRSRADAIAFVETVPDCRRRIVSLGESGEFAVAEVELSGDRCPRPPGTVIGQGRRRTDRVLLHRRQRLRVRDPGPRSALVTNATLVSQRVKCPPPLISSRVPAIHANRRAACGVGSLRADVPGCADASLAQQPRA